MRVPVAIYIYMSGILLALQPVEFTAPTSDTCAGKWMLANGLYCPAPEIEPDT